MKKIIAILFTIITIISFSACGKSHTEVAVTTTTKVTNAKHTYVINGEEQTVLPYYPIEDNYVMEIVEKGYRKFHIYNANSITTETLETRTNLDRIIIERVVGIVTNENGDGEILNISDSNDYINYSDTDLDYTTGTIIVSYFMYNPDTNDVDDIIGKKDYILDRSFEVELK